MSITERKLAPVLENPDRGVYGADGSEAALIGSMGVQRKHQAIS